ncbi:MAG: hypothetical protein LWW92_05510 [Rhodocyclales bacterium]|nr:hypothetical protein [Rhodocyclales bacterium]
MSVMLGFHWTEKEDLKGFVNQLVERFFNEMNSAADLGVIVDFNATIKNSGIATLPFVSF